MKEYGFAELCFQCDVWVTDKGKWRTHCQTHLDDIATLPFLFNPLTFRRTLAAAGQCPWCAFNPALDPEIRFKQFPYAQPWKEHINEHFTDLESEEQSCGGPDESKTFQCPDTRCGLSFDSVQDLRYHCHCSQGIDLIKFTPLKSRARGKKRSVEASRGPESKKRRIDFVNETVETLSSPDRLIPEDEAGGKPRRGRPRKYPAPVSKGESLKREAGGKARGRPRKQPAPVSKGESGVKLGELRPLRRESSAALSSTVQGKRGRKKKRIRYTASPAGSSSRSGSSQSRITLSSTELEGNEFQRDPDDETTSLTSWSASIHHDASPGLEPGNEAGSESDSEYELVESGGTHGSYWVSRKRRGLTTPAQGVATRPQVVIYV
jgi:hypothetical protein